ESFTGSVCSTTPTLSPRPGFAGTRRTPTRPSTWRTIRPTTELRVPGLPAGLADCRLRLHPECEHHGVGALQGAHRRASAREAASELCGDSGPDPGGRVQDHPGLPKTGPGRPGIHHPRAVLRVPDHHQRPKPRGGADLPQVVALLQRPEEARPHPPLEARPEQKQPGRLHPGKHARREDDPSDRTQSETLRRPGERIQKGNRQRKTLQTPNQDQHHC
ncbi:hypothetical protein OIY81_2806, partial [Cryptosporidium canis]